ncbi:MAG: hypothetical protein ABRQ37_01910 [Candidatus Eremiobacterota bacterium]
MNNFYYSLKKGSSGIGKGIICLIFGISMIGSGIISMLDLKPYLEDIFITNCLLVGDSISYGGIPRYDGKDPFTTWFIIGGIIFFYIGIRTFVNMLTQRVIFLYNQEITRG